ncbi:plasmid pRiA4b ORF-3 family protein [Phaeodactylibacter luteus]|uniref:Plasmid pRiA4b ORF-3 family protein n=1 Tax=Phaeodactylibacter luteus TaxID=1564516 RepID=A0A5C6RIZ2_9BACT|nr:plasmid pRiA4b ORF-3 family protein [Phaeodactylibacter luteus]TXB62093.1 plasmid pRiA4b ORF-3 family protein [Phaeodactylibacter luteus]
MSQTILQLKITLMGSQKPPIWRQVQIPAGLNFVQLHVIIQGAMGWENSHLHAFTDRWRSFSIGMPDGFDMDDMQDGWAVKVEDYLSAKGDTLIYEYDFGDSWEHRVEVQKVLEAAPGETYPKLLKGKGACPPEDCGGIGGYYYMMEAVNDPGHEGHDDMVEWLGVEKWDVHAFDEAYARERMLNYYNSVGGS